MITIQFAVEEIIKKSPYLEEALSQKIINSRALARQLIPQIKNTLFKNIQLGAVSMAIERLEKKLQVNKARIKPLLKIQSDFTVKSNLISFTFINSDFLFLKQRRLLVKINNQRNLFLTWTQSLYQSTIIINSNRKNEVEQIFKEEKIISKINDLSAITLTLTEETVKTPGIYYAILKTLAWYGINIIEIVSSFTELTIVLESSCVDKAFTVLRLRA